MIILGIDPGTATTGYGLISCVEKKAKMVDYGCILTTSKSNPGERLKAIYNELEKIIKKHKPSILAIESIYFFKNSKTAIPVSQARGVILLSASKKNIPVYEFTPLQVKMVVAGYGRAEKKQVQEMIKLTLDLSKIPKPDDAADALGIALCCQRFIEQKDRFFGKSG